MQKSERLYIFTDCVAQLMQVHTQQREIKRTVKYTTLHCRNALAVPYKMATVYTVDTVTPLAYTMTHVRRLAGQLLQSQLSYLDVAQLRLN